MAGVTIGLLRSGRDGTPIARWTQLCVLLWMWVTPAALLIISLGDPMFVERYLLAALPAVAIGIGLLVARLRPQALEIGVGLLVLAVLVPGQLSLFDHRGDRWTDAAAVVADGMGPG